MHVVRIDPLDRIARLEKAFFVKGPFGLFGVAPVARGDVGAAVAHLCFALHVHQLQLQTWGGYTQVARLDKGVGHEDAERTGFGHPKACAHDDALAHLALLRFVEAVPDGLGQSGTCVKEHLNAREQGFAQRVVGLHRVGDGFKARGHIEVHRGCDLAQVAQCLVHQGRRWLAIIDVQGAAVEHGHAEVVVAAKGVVPGQPIDQHQLLFSQDGHGLRHLLLVGAPQAVGVDDGFGQLGGAAGEQKLGNGVRACRGHGRIHRRCRGCSA